MVSSCGTFKFCSKCRFSTTVRNDDDDDAPNNCVIFSSGVESIAYLPRPQAWESCRRSPERVAAPPASVVNRSFSCDPLHGQCETDARLLRNLAPNLLSLTAADGAGVFPQEVEDLDVATRRLELRGGARPTHDEFVGECYFGSLCLSPYLHLAPTDGKRGPLRDIVVGDTVWAPRYGKEKYTTDDHEHFGTSEYFLCKVLSDNKGNFQLQAYGSNAELLTEPRWTIPFSSELNKPELRKWVRILTPSEEELFKNASVKAWVWSDDPLQEKWITKKVSLYGPLLSWFGEDAGIIPGSCTQRGSE
jgi:hypothetical protein